MMTKHSPGEGSPWLSVALDDYEGHMEADNVAQAQLLRACFAQTVARHRPASLAILGAAGGNGLGEIDANVVRRVSAIDINAHYLQVCRERHAARFEHFETIEHDLRGGAPALPAVQCVFAGLILEYLDWAAATSWFSSLLTENGVFAVVLQMPAPHLPVVTDTPFAALRQLSEVFNFVPPRQFAANMRSHGFRALHEATIPLPSGKQFSFSEWRRG